MVWDNLHKILLVDTPINNVHIFSVLMRFLLGVKCNPLTDIHILYSRLIFSITIVSVSAIYTDDNGIIDHVGALSQYWDGTKK